MFCLCFLLGTLGGSSPTRSPWSLCPCPEFCLSRILDLFSRSCLSNASFRNSCFCRPILSAALGFSFILMHPGFLAKNRQSLLGTEVTSLPLPREEYCNPVRLQDPLCALHVSYICIVQEEQILSVSTVAGVDGRHTSTNGSKLDKISH